jgi:hypothetical protein
MDSPFSEGDLWLGLRSCYKHGRGPYLLYPHARKLSNKKANYSEETNKVKRRLKIVKRGGAVTRSITRAAMSLTPA